MHDQVYDCVQRKIKWLATYLIDCTFYRLCLVTDMFTVYISCVCLIVYGCNMYTY